MLVRQHPSPLHADSNFCCDTFLKFKNSLKMKFAVFAVVICLCVKSGEAVEDVLDLGPLYTFKNITTWEASENTQRKYPYYFAGTDKEDHPLFVCEVGRWNFRKAVEGDATDFEQMRRQIAKALWYTQQAATGNVNKVASDFRASETEDFPDGVAWILDTEGFDYFQMASPKTLLFFIEAARVVSKVTDQIAYVYLINTNFLVETVLNLIKPALGTLAERIEVGGANKARWSPTLLKRISKDQLPAWYGGTQEFQPIKFFGK